MRENADLPFASTLCGSCSHVCPVKIDIHDQLWKWRQILTAEGYVANSKKVGMKGMAFVLAHPSIYRFAGKMARWALTTFPTLSANRKFNPWAKQRELPIAPKESFREWFLKNKG